jgi:transposase
LNQLTTNGSSDGTDFQLSGFRWRTCVLSDADHDNLIKPVVRFFATRSPFPCKVCPMRSLSEIDRTFILDNVGSLLRLDTRMSKRFRECSLDQPFLLPPSLQDWLPENHLARFVADVVHHLDLREIYDCYERKDGRGLAAYHPETLTRLLLYGYSIGEASSRY